MRRVLWAVLGAQRARRLLDRLRSLIGLPRLDQSGYRMNRKTVPVSVVIPCYRCSETIERAVDSVAQQSVVPVEIILVDDASRDATVKKLKELERDIRPTGYA